MDTDGMQFENPIDNLTYLYDDTNKNQLLRVFDSTANPQGFSDDSDGISDTEDDYAYDDNGNMTHDDNKGITHITYNHLNLPVEIIFGTYGKIAYLYNATGQKLKKTVTEGTTITTTDYLSGFQYKNLVLQFFPHAEGYVNATEEMVVMGGTSYRFNYMFNYTDHLGNIRLSYSLDPSTKVLKIIEENHYYPFGLKHSGYNSDKMMYTKEAEVLKIKPVPPLFITSYKYKYNGKEYQDELGLNVTAMDFRMYDNALGRFHNMDKLTDIMPSLSPYRFAFNNPVLWNDPTGLLESGGGDDDEFFLQGQEVVITPDSGVSQPASFNYALIDWSQVDNRKRPTLAQYNKHNGTSYTSFDDYYFNEHYVPAYKKMRKDQNEAGRKVVGTLTLLATAGIGTAYALPIVAASPSVTSFFAAEVTGYTTITGQTAVTGMSLNALSQAVANGGDVSKVNLIEVASSAAPGVGPTIIGETFNFNFAEKDKGIQTPQNLNQGVLQIGGGLLSNYGGNKIDGFNANGAVQNAYKEVAKFMIETGSNVAPALESQIKN